MKRTLVMFLAVMFIVGCKKDDAAPTVPAVPDPTRVFLNAVVIEAMPFVDGSGIAWDLGSGPDPYFNLRATATVVQTFRGNYRPDITPSSLPLTWVMTFEFTDWGQYYNVDLWDYDPLDPDDFIGSTNLFRMNDVKAAGYPTSWTVSNSSGSIRVRLTLTWL